MDSIGKQLSCKDYKSLQKYAWVQIGSHVQSRDLQVFFPRKFCFILCDGYHAKHTWNLTRPMLLPVKMMRVSKGMFMWIFFFWWLKIGIFWNFNLTSFGGCSRSQKGWIVGVIKGTSMQHQVLNEQSNEVNRLVCGVPRNRREAWDRRVRLPTRDVVKKNPSHLQIHLVKMPSL